MFEVAWCVTLYTTVLATEVSVMVFEKLRWRRATRIGHALTFPLTLAAVLLSMLHQSSLGSLFLIVPGRLHELWYTPLLPVLFFLSAVGVGLTMAVIESNLSARAFGRALENDLLRRVARVAAVVMVLYLAVRLSDMAYRGAFAALWPLDRAAAFFLLEIALGFIIPIMLFSSERVVQNRRRLYHAAQIALLGFIINRLNVAVTGFEVVSGEIYVPAWTEVAITLMVVTVGVVAFYLAARFLPVFEHDVEAEARDRSWESELARQAARGSLRLVREGAREA
jgi:Ni/Fe-hydrogenase subunit HybB-like protein